MYCRYANEVLGEKAARLWNDVTIDEVKAYIAINIIMGINCLPTLDSYWSTHPALGCDWISSTMSKNRYMAINRFLHLNDNAFAAPRNHPGYDPLHKVRPMIDMLRMVFGAYYNPERELSVDEAMIPFRGRSVFKQYIPSKPTKWGIKVWMICESRSGYCLDFDIYTGRNTNTWILWKKSDDHPAEMQKFDHLKFCLYLADELRGGFASKNRARGRPSSTIVPCINTVKGHELVRIQGRVRICRQCPRSQRFTASGRKKETSFMCETYKVPMCRFPCFAEFHGLREA